MQGTLFTYRANGNMYRLRKAPVETDDTAADRGWFIAKHSGKSAQSPPKQELYTRSLQYVQTQHLDMVFEQSK